ncbi:hypothetical protein [Azospirillum soli]|uniref:hypothetical protein n=1 Tax=Azospirillum soli TaxID=1304799 RepID=UPI001AE5D92A|nr:hypothetical protein [Azospirillum soli]MBP2313426.1 hypothetical protein [Azospirillum soli]
MAANRNKAQIASAAVIAVISIHSQGYALPSEQSAVPFKYDHEREKSIREEVARLQTQSPLSEADIREISKSSCFFGAISAREKVLSEIVSNAHKKVNGDLSKLSKQEKDGYDWAVVRVELLKKTIDTNNTAITEKLNQLAASGVDADEVNSSAGVWVSNGFNKALEVVQSQNRNVDAYSASNVPEICSQQFAAKQHPLWKYTKEGQGSRIRMIASNPEMRQIIDEESLGSAKGFGFIGLLGSNTSAGDVCVFKAKSDVVKSLSSDYADFLNGNAYFRNVSELDYLEEYVFGSDFRNLSRSDFAKRYLEEGNTRSECSVVVASGGNLNVIKRMIDNKGINSYVQIRWIPIDKYASEEQKQENEAKRKQAIRDREAEEYRAERKIGESTPIDDGAAQNRCKRELIDSTKGVRDINPGVDLSFNHVTTFNIGLEKTVVYKIVSKYDGRVVASKDHRCTFKGRYLDSIEMEGAPGRWVKIQ